MHPQAVAQNRVQQIVITLDKVRRQAAALKHKAWRKCDT
jgi:hypothetical protein